MTVALVANIARPISSAISTAFSADSYGALSSYGLLGASAELVAIPDGYGAVPFGVSIYKSGSVYSTDFDPTDYRLVEGGPGVTTYYVDKATGLDTNAGTSSEPFKTILKAISFSRGDAPTVLVKVKGGTYYLTENMNDKRPEATNLSIISWDNQPVICSNENTNIVPASWTLDSSNTYYSSVAGYGYSEYRSSAWDGKIGDGFGDYLPLIPVASIAECKSTSNSYYTDTAALRIYVHCSDNRAPDADIHVFEAWSSPGQYKDYPGLPSSAQCYFENVHFFGGAIAFAIEQSHATNTTTSVFNNCSFKYAGVSYPQTVHALGNIDVALYGCLVAESHGDGFSYQSYGSNPAPRAIEIDCEARRCGSLLLGTANQGTSMHDGGKIVRVNGNYHHNENDQVADVGNGTLAWLVSCIASDGLKAGYSGFLCGNGTPVTNMWVDSCESSNNTYGIYCGTGSTTYTNSFTSDSGNTGAGSIVAY